MAEQAALRRGPLDASAHDADARAALLVAAQSARFVLRCGPDALAAAGKAFGVALPDTCRAAVSEGRAALWLGPDEWFLLVPPDEADAITRKLATEVTAPQALVDVSHRSLGIVVQGPRAAELINCGCPLDLRTHAFPVGMCTRTVFDKAEIVLWRVNEARYHLEIERSLAQYLHAMLIESRAGLARG
jgi:sarcosine oxidase subunit gamma